MPAYEVTGTYPRPVSEVFEFFRRPANLLALTPPDMHLQLVQAPERLERGSRVEIKGKRWGVPQRSVTQVTWLEQDALLVIEQVEGPLKRWAHTHRFAAADGTGTLVKERVEYEPPGGMLGLVLTEALVRKELEALFAYRAAKLRELLGAAT